MNVSYDIWKITQINTDSRKVIKTENMIYDVFFQGITKHFFECFMFLYTWVQSVLFGWIRAPPVLSHLLRLWNLSKGDWSTSPFARILWSFFSKLLASVVIWKHTYFEHIIKVLSLPSFNFWLKGTSILLSNVPQFFRKT